MGFLRDYMWNNYISIIMTNNSFLQWFIGFSEGVGSWIIRKNLTIGFEISQHSCDASLLYEIKKQLNFGTVNHNSKVSLSRYCLTKNHHKEIIKIFNNNLKCNYRYFQFYCWCQYIKLYLDSSIDINNLSKDFNKISMNNAWLSGFIDAEGSFRIAIDKKDNNNPKIIFEISQKEIEILKEIAEFLSLKKNIRKDQNNYVLYTSNYNARKKLITYLDKFPLKTKKNISYINWKKAHNLNKNDNDYLNKILELKLKISNNVKNI